MPVATFHDIARHFRCPYERRMDANSGLWTISGTECMDLSVRDAVMACEQRRVMEGRQPSRDEALALYWESWDRHYPDVEPKAEANLGVIRFGERCVDNYLRMCGSDRRYVAAVNVSGVLILPGEREVMVAIDSVRTSGSTATVCRYVCDPGLRSASELSADREMRMCALWTLQNIAGVDRVRMRWEFLGSGTSTECSAIRDDLLATARDVSDIVASMESDTDVLPRESDHCLECRYRPSCPRMLHELSLMGDPSAMSMDEGVILVDEYAELQEKIDALKRRQEALELSQRAIAERIVAFSDANGFMAVAGHRAKALVRHDRKVELPEDKTAIIARLRETGQYDALSMPNYPRLRSDIAKGVADPEISRMAEIVDVPKVHLRRRRRDVLSATHPS